MYINFETRWGQFLKKKFAKTPAIDILAIAI